MVVTSNRAVTVTTAYHVVPEDHAAEILAAGVEILGADFEHGFRDLARRWHPDTCKNPRAAEVMAHLTRLRRKARGEEVDPVEHVRVAGGELIWKERTVTLAAPGGLASRTTLSWLAGAHTDVARRLPTVTEATADTLTLARPDKAVSMAAVQAKFPGGIPAKHVAWMASRLYELVLALDRGAEHRWGGLTVESLMVLPIDHGVIPLDPRFVTLRGEKLRAVPGPLVPLVPSDKLASVGYEVACVNRIALTLLGDPSGTGNALLKRVKAGEIEPKFFEWFRAPTRGESRKNYEAYREMLVSVWGPPKYHKLEM